MARQRAGAGEHHRARAPPLPERPHPAERPTDPRPWPRQRAPRRRQAPRHRHRPPRRRRKLRERPHPPSPRAHRMEQEPSSEPARPEPNDARRDAEAQEAQQGTERSIARGERSGPLRDLSRQSSSPIPSPKPKPRNPEFHPPRAQGNSLYTKHRSALLHGRYPSKRLVVGARFGSEAVLS